MSHDELPIECVVWDAEEGRRQDQAYEAGRYTVDPKIAAKNELIYALHDLGLYTRLGRMPPQAAQERLCRARMEAERLGVKE